MSVRLNIGSSDRHIPGFTSVDVRPILGGKRGHAGDLSFVTDGAVDVLFVNAVFEHVYLAHHLAVLREWGRVLAADGVIVALGVPDFEVVARLYLDRQRGILGDRFDLYHVYRYSHGSPEIFTRPVWATWDPSEKEDCGPPGFLPQLHKTLFDCNYLSMLLRKAALSGRIFRYAYPGESYKLNLGFVIGSSPEDGLGLIPNIEEFVRLETVEDVDSDASDPELLLDEAAKLDLLRPLSRWKQAWYRVPSRARGFIRAGALRYRRRR